MSASASGFTFQDAHRLAHLTDQLDDLTGRLAQLESLARAGEERGQSLLYALTATGREDALRNQLAELLVALSAQGEQTDRLLNHFSELARSRDFQTLAENVARSADLSALEDRIAKQVRTQFKANAVSESQLEQLRTSLDVLRELAERREERSRFAENEDRRRLEEARNRGRRDLAGDLLPAIDGLELFMENGRSWLAHRRESVAQFQRQAELTRAQLQPEPGPAQSPTWQERWRNFWTGTGSEELPVPVQIISPPPPADDSVALTEMTDEIEAWLAGLELTYDRFMALLAMEGIQPIDAQNQPFDPRLHVALGAVDDESRPDNTVVEVVRKGYRQGERVLRYAEVIVGHNSPPSSAEGDAADITNAVPADNTTDSVINDAPDNDGVLPPL
ncbi:MAG: nucleotide exchange factor GrpE [Caldilineaceae bacterium]|nr:nucleotide exchange factor GrpE [Caldilineaceae bacterium]